MHSALVFVLIDSLRVKSVTPSEWISEAGNWIRKRRPTVMIDLTREL